MDILFIDPPWVIENKGNLWKRVKSCLPSLGIAYIAAYLEKHGFTAAIVDCTAERVAVADIGARLAAYRTSPPRYIGITATSALFANAMRVASACKAVFPDAIVVVGGVHPTVEPESTLDYPAVDCVVRGEGEATALDVVSGKPWPEIAGLSFRANGGVVHNADRPLIADLDQIPPPAYHLLPMDRYSPAVGSYKRLPAMSIFATRGCPSRCTFCYRSFFGKVRKRSAANVIAEIQLLQRDYGIREIAFYDDTFTVFRDVIVEFCRSLLRDGIDITWSCFSRVDRIDSELLRLMKAAGCHLILFGVESADPAILKNIRKRISLEQAERAVRDARRAGIETRASFMFGNPGETEDTIRRTIEYAIRLDPDQAQFNITTVYPGTEMYAWAKENGYLMHNGDDSWNVSDINMRLPTVEPEVLQRFYKIAHVRFFFRPKVIFRRLSKIRTLPQLAQELQGAGAVLLHAVSRLRRTQLK